MKRYLVGVDEAGRGPLAGPVAVGIVVAPVNFDIKKAFPGVADSKVLSEKKREELYAKLQNFAYAKKMDFRVIFASAKMIDKRGITAAVHHCIYKGIRTLVPDPRGHKVLLDGLLHAPPEYAQQTIIGGDASDAIISLASIAAKVTRDRLMRRYARTYPGYGFEAHKGYGTKQHQAAIRQLGASAIHRKSFKGSSENL